MGLSSGAPFASPVGFFGARVPGCFKTLRYGANISDSLRMAPDADVGALHFANLHDSVASDRGA